MGHSRPTQGPCRLSWLRVRRRSWTSLQPAALRQRQAIQPFLVFPPVSDGISRKGATVHRPLRRDIDRRKQREQAFWMASEPRGSTAFTDCGGWLCSFVG